MDKIDTGKKKRKIIVLLAVIQIFNGLSGIAGGFGLLSDTSGAAVGLELTWLQQTPFSNYLIPGLVLLIVNGFGNVSGFILTIRKHRKFDLIAVFFGLIMMVWIISQAYWIGYKSLLQPVYFGTGLMQFMLGLMINKKGSV